MEMLMEWNLVANANPRCLTRIRVNKVDTFQVSSTLSYQKGKDKGNRISTGRNCRFFCEPGSLGATLQSKKICKVDNSDSGSPLEESLSPRPPNSEELKALLVDVQRANLLRQLSEANQQNRLLKRQLRVKENDLLSFKREIAQVEFEIEVLVGLAEEISNYSVPDGSRKINGIPIQSHLLSQLQIVQERLKEQIKEISAAESKQVSLFWHGLAESVQVMGSFNGWIEGEGLSPESTDSSYTRFSTTLMLRPGTYEIKFLVDGKWLLSPEFPTVGEGLTQNNLLVVE